VSVSILGELTELNKKINHIERDKQHENKTYSINCRFGGVGCHHDAAPVP
jgi:hypothetical protein